MIFIEKKELSELEIRELIDHVLDGDTVAFEKIYDMYYKMIASIVRRIVRPAPSEMDAIINEAFLIVFRGLKGFKGNAKFSTYVYRIVLNFCFKISKKKSKDRKHLTYLGEHNDTRTIEDISSFEKTDEEIINRTILENSIGKLSKDLQEALDLYYYERYSVKEIAMILHTTETAIKNRLYQARHKIKVDLEKAEVINES